MPIKTDRPATLTPRERAELDWEKESTHLQATLVEKQDAAKLSLETLKATQERNLRQYELDIKRLEVKWLTALKIPLSIVLLPVKLIMALAIPIAAITGKELDKHFWELMK